MEVHVLIKTNQDDIYVVANQRNGDED